MVRKISTIHYTNLRSKISEKIHNNGAYYVNTSYCVLYYEMRETVVFDDKL